MCVCIVMHFHTRIGTKNSTALGKWERSLWHSTATAGEGSRAKCKRWCENYNIVYINKDTGHQVRSWCDQPWRTTFDQMMECVMMKFRSCRYLGHTCSVLLNIYTCIRTYMYQIWSIMFVLLWHFYFINPHCTCAAIKG